MIIGVTGKSGVGKSTYAKAYAKRNGCYYLDIDEIGHQVLDDPEVQKKCLEKFGVEVSSNDRKKLGELVFANRHKMQELSDFTWEKMKSKILLYPYSLWLSIFTVVPLFLVVFFAFTDKSNN